MHGSFSGDAEDFLSRTGSSGLPPHARRPVVHADFRHAFQADSRLGQHPRDHQRLTARLQLQTAAYEAERQLSKREADERGFGRGDFHNPHLLFPGDAFSGERQTREPGLGLGLGLGPGRSLGLGLGAGSVEPSRPVPSFQTLHRLKRRLPWEEGPDLKTWPRGGPDSPFAALRRQVLQDARAGREGVQSLSGTAAPPRPQLPPAPLPLQLPPSPPSGMRKRPSQAQRCSEESRRRREDFDPSLLLLHRQHSQLDRNPQWDVGEEDEVNNVSVNVNVNVSVAASHETRAKNEADNNSFSRTSHAGPHTSNFLSVSRQPLSQALETASSNPTPTAAAAAAATAAAAAVQDRSAVARSTDACVSFCPLAPSPDQDN